MDPWSRPETVAGFARSQPNAVLMRFAAGRTPGLALDIGCGAGRNAVPLARAGWDVVGIDLSAPMLAAARGRDRRFHPVLAAMDAIPLRDRSVDLVIAHGVWNLARSAARFRAAVAEAARVATAGAALFVFTFSRSTLPPEVRPVLGEPFVYTEFAGEPQCFLTREQLFDETATAGFYPDPAVPLTEYNRPGAGPPRHGGPPAIWEAAFRRTGPPARRA